jgi:hypothetical protein
MGDSPYFHVPREVRPQSFDHHTGKAARMPAVYARREEQELLRADEGQPAGQVLLVQVAKKSG